MGLETGKMKRLLIVVLLLLIVGTSARVALLDNVQIKVIYGVATASTSIRLYQLAKVVLTTIVVTPTDTGTQTTILVKAQGMMSAQVKPLLPVRTASAPGQLSLFAQLLLICKSLVGRTTSLPFCEKHMKKLILVLVCLITFVSSFYVANMIQKQQKEQQKEERHLRLSSEAYAKDKLLSKEDYLKFDTLIKKTANRKSMSEEDFRWMMQTVEPAFHSKDWRMTLVRDKATTCLQEMRDFTSYQREEAVKHVMRLLRPAPDMTPYKLDHSGALAVAGELKDKRTVEYILPYVNSKHPITRGNARWALKAMNVPVDTAANP